MDQWTQRSVVDKCSGQTVLLDEWDKPVEYYLRRCPIHEARDLPAWMLDAPDELLLYWHKGFLKWPGPVGDQPKRWVEAMWHLEQLFRKEGFLTDPMELFLQAMTKPKE